MWFSKLRAAAVAPALFAAYLGLATSAQALPAPLPALLPHQEDGVFITDSAGRNYTFQTNVEDPANEFFIRLLGLPLGTSPVAPQGFTPGIVQLLESDGSVSDLLALRTLPITNRYSVFFISDGASDVVQFGFDVFALGLPILAAIPETGKWQDVGSFFHVAAGEIYVQSGVVPEPASLALLGSALIGFGVIRRRKRA